MKSNSSLICQEEEEGSGVEEGQTAIEEKVKPVKEEKGKFGSTETSCVCQGKPLVGHFCDATGGQGRRNRLVGQDGG